MFAASKSGKPAAAGAFNNVTLLLETTGTNGQQNNTFLDSSTNNFAITRTGTPTQGTFTPFSQTGWSGYFNGSTDYVSAPSATAFAFGSGVDFTVEAWVYPLAYGASSAGGSILGTVNGTVQGWSFNLGESVNAFRLISNASGSWADTLTAGTGNGPQLNQWSHVALVRSGATLSIYKNGALMNSISTASTYNFTSPNNVIYSGFYSDSAFTRYVNGYISNARVVKGTALYTGSTYTVPTAPLTAVTNTSLLTLQSNYFKDNSSNNFAITATGTPSIQAISPFNGGVAYSTSAVGGSGYFNGTTDWLTIPYNSAFTFGAGDFTIEAWLNPNRVSGSNAIISGVWDGLSSPPQSWILYLNTTGTLGFAIDVASVDIAILTSTTIVSNSVWTHIAITRSGSNWQMFINGISAATATNSSTISAGTAVLYLGSYQNKVGSDALFNGYIFNFRIVKGTALYTANFTPPTAPLTAVTNTSLLLSATNSGIYDATAKNDVTTVGSAQVSTAQSQFGGSSMLFNGTTDYLTAIDTPNLQLGTGDFTIEGWVYPTTGSTARGIIAKGTAITGWECRLNAANIFRFEWTASSLVGATTIPINTWTYFAVVRSGTATGNVKIYINGTLYATSAGAVTDNFNQTSVLRVGLDRPSTSFFPGYIDDLRITRTALYTANFTPPTVPFPVS